MIIKKFYIKKYIIKHLINLNYSKNSFFYEYIDNKIEKAFEKNSLDKIDYIIFYYTSDKNKEIYNKIMDKYLETRISFYLFLENENEINTEQNMTKTINLLENLTKNTAQYSKIIIKREGVGKNYISYREREKMKEEINKKIISKRNLKNFQIKTRYKRNRENFVEALKKRKKSMKFDKLNRETEGISNKYDNSLDKIINLYKFFRMLQKENKKLINIINDNYIFLRETIEVFLNQITLYKNHKYQSLNEFKDKKQILFLNSQIFDFFKSLFDNIISNELLNKYFEDPVIYDKYEYKIKLLKFFENGFIQRIIELKYDTIPNDEYESYKQILIKFCKYNYYNNKIFKKTLVFLFMKDVGKLIDFLDINIYIN